MARPAPRAGRSGSPSSARDPPASTRRSTSSASRASPSRWTSTTACRRRTAWSGSGWRPDHQKIKNVTAAFDKTAAHPGFRFFGNVELGKDVTIEDLRAHYHQIVYTTGAQTDRRMGIPGEDLRGSHPATDFVAWYNGHPDYREQPVRPLAGAGGGGRGRQRRGGRGADPVPDARRSSRRPTSPTTPWPRSGRAACARSTCSAGAAPPRRPSRTRRCGSSASCRAPTCVARPDEVELDPLSRAELEKSGDRRTLKKVEILREYARRAAARQAADPGHPLPRLAGRRSTAARTGRRRPAAGQERAPRDGGRHAPGPRHRSVRGAAGGPRLPLGRLPGRADPRRPVPRRLGRDPERQGAGPRAGQPRAPPGRVRGRLDQARADRRHRHQQARRGGDRRLHGGGPGAGPRARAVRAGAGRRPGARPPAPAPATSRGADWQRLDALEVARGRASAGRA